MPDLHHWDSGSECTISKFAGDARLSGAVTTSQGCHPEGPGQALEEGGPCEGHAVLHLSWGTTVC